MATDITAYLRTYEYKGEHVQLRATRYGKGKGTFFKVVRGTDNLQTIYRAFIKTGSDKVKAALAIAEILDYDPLNSARVKASDWVELALKHYGFKLVQYSQAEIDDANVKAPVPNGITVEDILGSKLL